MWRVEINDIPPSLNAFYSGMHWTKRKLIMDKWHLLFLAAFRRTLPDAIKCPVTLSATIYAVRQPRDCDNAVIAIKAAGDALKIGGYIPDDSPEYVTTVILSSKKSTDKKNKTVLIIE
jgi:Holliday junction resolvase RusA-like endonuclease